MVSMLTQPLHSVHIRIFYSEPHYTQSPFIVCISHFHQGRT